MLSILLGKSESVLMAREAVVVQRIVDVVDADIVRRDLHTILAMYV